MAKLLNAFVYPPDMSVKVSFGDIAEASGAQDTLLATPCIGDRRFVVSLVMPAVKRASKHIADQRVHASTARRVHASAAAIEQWLAGDDTVELHEATLTARVARAAAYRDADSATDFADVAAYKAAHAASEAVVNIAFAAAAAHALAAAAHAAATAAHTAAAAAYAAAAARTADDAAVYSVAAHRAERQQQVADIIARSPLHALKEMSNPKTHHDEPEDFAEFWEERILNRRMSEPFSEKSSIARWFRNAQKKSQVSWDA
ncbi:MULTISPECIES: hypothetical protein [Mesorhizobium]|uniref:hypothetical protein n=1 Tax=Mesorhizobium TaxID=68287 RepID=UPI0010C11F15|nr:MULTISPECIES: hypothetical protein [Mesorhizobium]